MPPSPKFYGFRSLKPLLVMDEFEAHILKSYFDYDAFIYCAKGKCITLNTSIVVVKKSGRLNGIQISGISIISNEIQFEAPPLVSIEKFGISNSFPNNIDTLKIEFLLRPAFKTNEMHIKDMKSDTIRISFLLDENPIDFEFVPVF